MDRVFGDIDKYQALIYLYVCKLCIKLLNQLKIKNKKAFISKKGKKMHPSS